MDSVLQKNKECYVCGTTINLHEHHIFYGSANRQQSEKYGLKVFLCAYHHNMSNVSVHFNKPFDRHLKCIAQDYFLANLGDIDDFRAIFGKSFK